MLLRGAIAHASARNDDAVAHYEEATTRFAALDMPLYAAVAKLRHGEILGASKGEALAQEAEAELRERGVRDVERFAAIFAPPPSR